GQVLGGEPEFHRNGVAVTKIQIQFGVAFFAGGDAGGRLPAEGGGLSVSGKVGADRRHRPLARRHRLRLVEGFGKEQDGRRRVGIGVEGQAGGRQADGEPGEGQDSGNGGKRNRRDGEHRGQSRRGPFPRQLTPTATFGGA